MANMNDDEWEDVPAPSASSGGEWEDVEPHQLAAPAPAAPKGRTPYSKFVSAAQGVTSGLMLDTDDEFSGLVSGIAAKANGKDYLPAYTKERDRYREEKNKTKVDNPWTYGLSNVAGSMGFPAGAAGNSARLGKAIGTGAMYGAAQGTVQGVGDAKDLNSVPSDAFRGGLIGGITGGIGGGIGQAISRPGKTMDEIGQFATETVPNYVKAMFGGMKEGSKDTNSLVSLGTAPYGGVKAMYDLNRKNARFQGLIDRSRAAGESVPTDTGLPALNRRYTDVERAPIDINSPKDYIDVEAVSGHPEPLKQLPGSREPGVMEPQTGMQQQPPIVERRKQQISQKPVISDDTPDDIYALRMLAEPGKDSIKKHHADVAGSSFPSNFDSDRYEKILEMGTEGRNQARRFNRDEAGGELVPKFEKSREVFDQARSQRWNELHGEARQQYQGDDKILQHIGDTLEDALSENGTKSIAPILQDIQNFVAAGKGSKSRGFSDGAWDQVNGAERFNRLQQARKELYDTGVHAKTSGLSRADQMIKTLTKKIDDELKISPEKVEADGMWRKSKQLEESFFDPADFKDGTVDKYKIGNMLKGTDSAKRFRDNIGRFESFINDPGLNPTLKKEGQELIDAFRGAANTAEEQRILNDFRFSQGPSSPAIERMTSILSSGGKNSPLTEATSAPSSFMGSMDNFTKSRSKNYYGKPYSELAPHEKDTLMKVYKWERAKRDSGFTSEEARAYFDKVKKKGGKSGPMSFNGGLPEDIRKAATDYVKSRALHYGADQAYNAATGTEDGLPDPLRDEATSFLKEKFNLSDEQAAVAKKMMPSVYDVARKGGRGVSNIYKNEANKLGTELAKTTGQKTSSRVIKHNGEDMTHEMFKDGDTITHLLKRGDKPVARIEGSMANMDGKKGFQVYDSHSITKGEGHGKKLYDLVLDSHDNMFSDRSLSELGSDKVYREHLKGSPGVDVDLADWNTPQVHSVSLRDKAAFQKDRGFEVSKPKQEFSSQALKAIMQNPKLDIEADVKSMMQRMASDEEIIMGMQMKYPGENPRQYLELIQKYGKGK